MKMNYIIYCRKSTDDKKNQVNSLEDQLSILRKLAQDRKLNVVAEYIEAKSAKKEGREKFNQMISQFEKKQANGILVWDINRLSRNPHDSAKIIHLVLTKTIEEIVTPYSTMKAEDGVMNLYVYFGLSNEQNRKLAIETKRGVIEKAQRGWYPSKPPIGYLPHPLKKKGEKEIIVDEERFPIVRKIFDLMLSGAYKPSEILRIATDEYQLRNKFGKKIAKHNVYRILTNSFYFGVFEFPLGSGNFYQGHHEPMITKEEYERIQILMGNRKYKRPKRKNFKYTGIMRCAECGAMITSEEKFKHLKNGKTLYYIYYRCTKRKDPNCTQKTIEEKKLEEQISQIISKIHIPDSFKVWAIDILKKENQKETKERDVELANIQRELTKCENQLNNLLDAYLTGEFPKEQVSEKQKSLNKTKLDLENKKRELMDKSSSWLNEVNTLFDFARTAKEKFDNGSPEDKKRILVALGSKPQLKDRKLSLEFEKPIIFLNQISNELKRVEMKNHRLEPIKTSDNIETYRRLTSVSTKLYPRQDSNL